MKQDEKSDLECAAKIYFQRLSGIWSSPLYDVNRVVATNQYTLPVLIYLMWTQHWPITELRAIDRETAKVTHEIEGKHPLSSVAVLYLPRLKGGRGLRSIEHEYKLTKIKTTVKPYQNSYTTNLVFNYSDPLISSRRGSGADVKLTKIKEHLRNGMVAF